MLARFCHRWQVLVTLFLRTPELNADRMCAACVCVQVEGMELAVVITNGMPPYTIASVRRKKPNHRHYRSTFTLTPLPHLRAGQSSMVRLERLLGHRGCRPHIQDAAGQRNLCRCPRVPARRPR